MSSLPTNRLAQGVSPMAGAYDRHPVSSPSPLAEAEKPTGGISVVLSLRDHHARGPRFRAQGAQHGAGRTHAEESPLESPEDPAQMFMNSHHCSKCREGGGGEEACREGSTRATRLLTHHRLRAGHREERVWIQLLVAGFSGRHAHGDYMGGNRSEGRHSGSQHPAAPAVRRGPGEHRVGRGRGLRECLHPTLSLSLSPPVICAAVHHSLPPAFAYPPWLRTTPPPCRQLVPSGAHAPEHTQAQDRVVTPVIVGGGGSALMRRTPSWGPQAQVIMPSLPPPYPHAHAHSSSAGLARSRGGHPVWSSAQPDLLFSRLAPR